MPATLVNPTLLKYAHDKFVVPREKAAFVDPNMAAMGGQPGMMPGAMPPGTPPGAAPGMDPSMMGGAPPGAAPGMDPASMMMPGQAAGPMAAPPPAMGATPPMAPQDLQGMLAGAGAPPQDPAAAGAAPPADPAAAAGPSDLEMRLTQLEQQIANSNGSGGGAEGGGKDSKGKNKTKLDPAALQIFTLKIILKMCGVLGVDVPADNLLTEILGEATGTGGGEAKPTEGSAAPAPQASAIQGIEPIAGASPEAAAGGAAPPPEQKAAAWNNGEIVQSRPSGTTEELISRLRALTAA